MVAITSTIPIIMLMWTVYKHQRDGDGKNV